MPPHSRRRGGGPLPREVTVSKAMSFVLRHGAEKEGIKLDSQGYANVADLLAWHKLRALGVTLAEVQSIVAHNDKQRFALASTSASTSASSAPDASSTADPSSNPSASTDPASYRIRATQGHSITAVTSSALSLTPLTPLTAPATVVHGTFPAAWRLILASGGLRRMGRNHVHFATGVPDRGMDATDVSNGAKEGKEVVISGMRRDATVLVWVDVRRAMEEGGLGFWRSENGVVLCEGDGEGRVGLEFVGRVVQRVRDRDGAWVERVLWEGGRVVGEVVGGESAGMGKGRRRGGQGGGWGAGRGQRLGAEHTATADGTRVGGSEVGGGSVAVDGAGGSSLGTIVAT